MPNPNDPDQHECKRCHDTGLIGSPERLCPCLGGAR